MVCWQISIDVFAIRASTLLCVQGVTMNSVQNHYLFGFILFSAILNAFIENESIGIQLLCLTLLLTTFVFASLFHSLRIKVAKAEDRNTE
jgi:hypothetical protein